MGKNRKHHSGGRPPQRNNSPAATTYFKDIFLENRDSKEMDSQTELFVKKKLTAKNNKLKPHQIRNFYSSVLQLKNEVDLMGIDLTLDANKQKQLNPEEERKWYNEIEPCIYKIKILLAFNSARHSSLSDLKKVVDQLIEKLATTETTKKRWALSSFLIICESIVAYHKYYDN